MDTVSFEWDTCKGIVRINIKNSKNEIIYSGKMTGYDFGKMISSGLPGLVERCVDNTEYMINGENK